MTVAKKAARPVKKVAKKKAVRLDDPFPNISAEDKQKLSELVMAFDEPGICREGRKRFLKSIEFPLPQRHAKVHIAVLVPVNDDEIEENAWGTETITEEEAVKNRALEFIGTDLEFDDDETYVDDLVD